MVLKPLAFCSFWDLIYFGDLLIVYPFYCNQVLLSSENTINNRNYLETNLFVGIKLYGNRKKQCRYAVPQKITRLAIFYKQYRFSEPILMVKGSANRYRL